MQNRQVDSGRFDAIFFDLDGTLLRVQMAEFIPRYIETLAQYCRDYAEPRRFARTMRDAIRSLIRDNGDGRQTNEQRFYSWLQRELDIPEQALRNSLRRYAAEQLDSLSELVRPIPLARQILRECQAYGIPMVLATNPVFPEFMIQARVRWGELEDIPFQHLSSFENSRHCKPHSGYFTEIADRLGLDPARCLMVGNDNAHDLAATAVGMKTFLVDTWLVEREGACWDYDQRGDHSALQSYLQQCFSGKE